MLRRPEARRGRLALVVCLAATTLSAVASASGSTYAGTSASHTNGNVPRVDGSAPEPTTITVAPSEVPAVLAEYGITLPADTCAANPALASCPPVSRVVVRVPTPWDSSTAQPSLSPSEPVPTGYGPSVSASGSPASPDAQEGFDCYVNGDDPTVTNIGSLRFLTGLAENFCGTGGDVTFQAVIGTLEVYLVAEGWVGEANCDQTRNGPGYIACTSTYYCALYSSYKWRNQATGYATVNGVGYEAVDTSASKYFLCR